MRTFTLWVLCVAFIACAAWSEGNAAPAPAEPKAPAKIIGMYVHQHWSYNHPYCARTWTLEDWRGYVT